MIVVLQLVSIVSVVRLDCNFVRIAILAHHWSNLHYCIVAVVVPVVVVVVLVVEFVVVAVFPYSFGIEY